MTLLRHFGRRRAAVPVGTLVAAAFGLAWGSIEVARVLPVGAPASVGLVGLPDVPTLDRPGPRALVVPNGGPATLSCEEARRVVQQARDHLASPPPPVRSDAFAEGLVDWLDPHGLWSTSPDSPVAPLARTEARRLLAEIDGPEDPDGCPTARLLGEELRVFATDLRAVYQKARSEGVRVPHDEAYRLAALPAFEDVKVTRPARELAEELGRRAGVLRATMGPGLIAYDEAALARFLPVDARWDEVVLAAAVRAYVPQIDPHGGWAPLDEETALYEIELEAAPPPRLWRKMSRTAVGIRVEETGAAGLRPGDVILRVGDVATGGLSVEQVEQLAFVDADPAGPVRKSVVVVSPGDSGPREVDVTLGGDGATEDRTSGLEAEIVAYGSSRVLVVQSLDVGESLSEDLVAAVHRAQAEGPVAGLVLDLRGNGGGSVEGAVSALGLFLPGAKLISTKRRDGTLDVDQAPEPPAADRFDGPVAALVDGDTASAAEMIAGSLAAYRRATVIGDRTFGKGCAQEYLEDASRSGVLRLTTLLYALPDGAPVQIVGIQPHVRLGLEPPKERESSLLHALAPWRGPDVRTKPLPREVAWPAHAGAVGPCKDPVVCRALRALGMLRASVAKGR